ncbi:hypothetical protein LSAT2_025592 [Lamellibrachia satsuma]|nr:hypothetical protein LSAT2_025592 [Lamellibrachia satsuma]
MPTPTGAEIDGDQHRRGPRSTGTNTIGGRDRRGPTPTGAEIDGDQHRRGPRSTRTNTDGGRDHDWPRSTRAEIAVPRPTWN